ncbi:ergothioneine biosynthesis protein EgtB [Bacillus sp. FJAT-44742]|uniref:ergothioneine biosynthesis protein EgtB n=1 Tax=Bacillus sp. FJAT-44742 TaxID=2014005 RepID=UPI001E2934B7|nr:ergothioneine biosynthesis protein EgtB [Bacillus sp. FJAT-44742]
MSTKQVFMTSEVSTLIDKYTKTRKETMNLVRPLEIEDFVIQSHEDVSPPKWHLAHTTWFFEQMILTAYKREYKVFSKNYHRLFNSYYESLGTPFPKPQRGLLSRPTVQEIVKYRNYVDRAIIEMLTTEEILPDKIKELMIIGINHEQQHQELLVTDIKYNYSIHPLEYPYLQEETQKRPASILPPIKWHSFEEGISEIGTNNKDFSFDNERPVHKHWQHAFSIASRPVSNKEFMEFIEDRGYERPELWLAEGWDLVRTNDWKAPLYWRKEEGLWRTYTVRGVESVNPSEPVAHISYFEADAYARWAGYRLPTEQEWEWAFRNNDYEGNFLESGLLHPSSFGEKESGKEFGDVWEWTRSPYTQYPKSSPLEGALGEYNAKFMSNKMVLRGGSCATPASHIRLTYRNFFPPEKRWQFSGFRLAKDGQ